MALVACRECSKEVSTEAKECPHCGVAKPAPSSGFNIGCGAALLIAIGVLIFVSLFSGRDKKVNTQTASSTWPRSISIRETQEALKHLDIDPGPVDGKLGPKTIVAIKKYQEGAGLPATGELDRETQDRLSSFVPERPSYLEFGTARSACRMYIEQRYPDASLAKWRSKIPWQRIKPNEILLYEYVNGYEWSCLATSLPGGKIRAYAKPGRVVP